MKKVLMLIMFAGLLFAAGCEDGKDGAAGIMGPSIWCTGDEAKDKGTGCITKASTQGKHGTDGATGQNGTDGSNGIDGTNGQDGSPGGKGSKGDTGFTGERGLKGDTGDTGDTGDKGDTGLTGCDSGETRDPTTKVCG